MILVIKEFSVKKRFVWPAAGIAQLRVFAESWARINHPSYKRGALRCKAMALINEDRMFDNKSL